MNSSTRQDVALADGTHAVSTQQYRDSLQRLRRYARLLDTRFVIPWLRVRIGWDAIIGLIPGFGDLAGLLLSLYVVVEARRLQVPGALLRRMLMNIAVEFVVGVVPVLGDSFDVYWKSNIRNVALLERYIMAKLSPPPSQASPLLLILLLVIGLGCGLLLLRWIWGSL